MFLKKKTKIMIYDAVHRSWVYSCWAVSAVALGFIAYQGAIYVTQIRPLKKELEAKIQEELLKEGRSIKDSSDSNILS